MVKNSDRARLEKCFEDLMDNDWRVFRARLVAQEQTVVPESLSKHSFSRVTQEAPSEARDEKQTRQDKFGNIFAAIFSGNNKKDNEEKSAPASIFDGDSIGGATPHSRLPSSCEDPFVSEAEIPVLMPTKITIDKHRWSHPMSHIEPGCILVANEKLGGVFYHTIVLITEHSDKKGTTGFVINKPMSGNLLKVASETESKLDLSLKMAFNSASVSYGGPVMQDEYSILHGYGEVEGARKIAPGVFIGGSEALMNEVRKQNMQPQEALFVKGHAAWIPGQLSREISKGVWYLVSCSNDFILRYAGAPISEEDNVNDLWADILSCMGGQYADIAKQSNSGKSMP